MKCSVCKATAEVALSSHNAAFCRSCYIDFFGRQVAKGIESQKLFTREERVLAALSGGKDSLSLALELKRQEYDVTAMFVDLAIPGSSAEARRIVENFCEMHSIPLIVKDMEKEGMPIPLVKKRIRRPVCSMCGKIKRYWFNKTALEGGFDAIATGHNLDDEVARLFSNTVRWDAAYLSDQGPMLKSENGFVRKVKPLWRLSEFETANYAFLMDIPHHVAVCPYSSGATFTVYKRLWQQLEGVMPGRKLHFYQGFLSHGRPAFEAIHQAEGRVPVPCSLCGYPTAADGICNVCRIREALKD